MQVIERNSNYRMAMAWLLTVLTFVVAALG